VNTGNARAADIEAVIAHIEATVREKTGIALLREVRIVGARA
jgi:UDP-N-acetylmuramate dehydrogenase